MHESAFTDSLLSLVLSKAQEAGGGKITRINVVIGEISGIVDDCVLQYFNILRENTPAESAELIFEKKSLLLKCRVCGQEFTPAGGPWECPECHEASVEILSGRDCYLQSIEVDNDH
ncbi:MAG TPA: hydrogenase maturation nickel metallochaperone HypA [Dehalococcoidales bacterium]|nr:hydrogenase maturation nickel metallochaperone HypA [Dehalococcoidales bacterium]